MSYALYPPWGSSETSPLFDPSLAKACSPVPSISYSPTPSNLTTKGFSPERKASVREVSPSAPFYARRSRQSTEGGRSDGSEYDTNVAEDTDQGSYRRSYEEDVDELDDDDVHSEEYGSISPPVQYSHVTTTIRHSGGVSELDGVRKTKKTIRRGGGTAHDVWHFFDKHTRSCGLCQ